MSQTHTPEQKLAFQALKAQIAGLATLQKLHKGLYRQDQTKPEFPASLEAFKAQYGQKSPYGPWLTVDRPDQRAHNISALLDLRRLAVGKDLCHGSDPDSIRSLAVEWGLLLTEAAKTEGVA